MSVGLYRKAKGIKLDGTIIIYGEPGTEIKFLIMLGDTKTLLRTRGRLDVLKENDPIEVTGSKVPLPTMID